MKPRTGLAAAALALATVFTPLSLPVSPTVALAAKEASGLKVTSFKLENGMQVVVIPDRRAPVVTHMVWYKAGSADEPPGKSGIAHYLEHLMFKGTKTVANGEFSARIAAIGGQENAFTSNDYTAYFQRVTPEALEEMMRLEADRMENLVLTDEKVLPEREVVQEERNSRTENNPGSLLREAMEASLYQNHRYGIPIIGWQHEVNTLTKEDAIAFYDKFYTPNNAILVVAGDVDEATVRALATKTYGKVKRRAEPGKRMRPSEPPPRAARRLEMSDARVRNPSFQRLYLVPSYYSTDKKEAEALDILSEILGGGSTSRMYRALVVEGKLASNAGAWFQGGALDQTEFGVYGAPLPGVDLKQLEEASDKVLTRLLAEGVTEREVKRASQRLVRSNIFTRDSQSTLARIYGAALTLGSTIEGVQSWPDRIEGVTVDQVNAVARKYLKRERSVTGYLTPRKQDNKEG